MSAKPRPRPRPRAKQSTDAPSPDTSASASSSKTQDSTSATSVDDFFMRSSSAQDFAAKAAKLAQLERKATKGSTIRISDSDNDDDEVHSSGGKRRRQEMGLPTAPKLNKLPGWTKNLARLSDTDDSDIVVLGSDPGEDSREESECPQAKRARSTTADKQVYTERRKEKQRQKTRSPSVSPPPEVTAAERTLARQKYQQKFPVAPRRSSPDPFLFADTSQDSILLNPELQKIANKLKSAPIQPKPNDPLLSGRPPIVLIGVTYKPHPKDPPSDEPKYWTFKLKRTQDFKIIFIRVAEQLKMETKRIKLCYKHEEVFKSVCPDNFDDIWEEAEFEAYLDTTLAYIRKHRGSSPSRNAMATPTKVSNPLAPNSQPVPKAGASAAAPTSEGEGDDEDEASDVIKINLQSSGQNAKRIQIKTRRTTLAMALLKHFVKAVTKEEVTDDSIKKKNIQLKLEGETVPYDMCCADMNDGDGLEDGECLDVVGL